jgi:hypothetical protein
MLARKLVAASGLAAADNTLVHDSFTDTDGTDITAHTPEIDVVGGGWITAGNWTTQNNRLSYQIGNSFVTIDAGASDVIITAGMVAANAHSLMFRHTSASAYWIARWNGVAVQLYEFNGAFQLRASTALSGSGPHELKVTLSGANISVLVNGGSETAYSSSANQSATQHGFRALASAGELADSVLIEAL